MQKVGRKNFLFSHFQKNFSLYYQYFFMVFSRDNYVMHFNPKTENIIIYFYNAKK
nr:MAG TPA: hypothetical protein [Caudoviricetes sp.]